MEPIPSWRGNRRTVGAALALASGFWPLNAALAAPPSAGQQIINQAAIVYIDETGEERVATTNEVVLTIQSVFAATLEGDRSVVLDGNEWAVFHHTLVNTGNEADTFCVTVEDLAGDDRNYRTGTLSVARDLNGNGVIDGADTTLHLATSGTGSPGFVALEPGERAQLIVTGQLFNTGNNFDYDVRLRVEAQLGTGSCTAGGVTDIGANGDGSDDTNINRATSITGAGLQMSKSSVYNDGGTPGDTGDDQITYTITVDSLGEIDALNVVVTDPIPANTTFQGGSIVEGGDETPFDTPAAFSVTDNWVQGGVDRLNDGDTLILTYTVDVNPGLQGGQEIENQASAVWSTGGPVLSNTVIDTLSSSYGFRFDDTETSANASGDVSDDVETVTSAAPGQPVRFRLRIVNTGAGADTFNLSGPLGSLYNPAPGISQTFPAGTAFFWRHADGYAPLLDTDGDDAPDTGPLAGGASRDVVLLAILPSNAAGGFNEEITATSSQSGGSDSVGVEILQISNPAVDIATDLAGDGGASLAGFNDAGAVNAHPAGSSASTQSAGPGEWARFDLILANEGAGPDAYRLAAYATAGGAALPDGWEVRFEIGGEAVTATPTLPAGGSQAIAAFVRVAPDAADGAEQAVFFEATSGATGGSDITQNRLEVAQRRALRLLTPASAQLLQCAGVSLRHDLVNLGGVDHNVTLSIAGGDEISALLALPTSVDGGEPADFEPIAALSAGENVLVSDGSAWSPVALLNGAGGPAPTTPGDIAIPLAGFERTVIEARFFAPCDATVSRTEGFTITASALGATAPSVSIGDSITIASALLAITKLGARDAACDGAPDGAFASAHVQALPGECVIWRIEASNKGAEPVCNVTVRDRAPAFTQAVTALIESEPAPGSGSCAVSSADMTCTIGNDHDAGGAGGAESHCLLAGESASVLFRVNID